MPKYSQRSLIQHEGETTGGSTMRTAAKPTPEHRYPRGYTPERQSAVSSALSKAPVVSKHHSHRDNPATKASPYLSSSEFFTPDPSLGTMGSPPQVRGNWKRTKEERHEVMSQQAHQAHVDAIARSTVPTEDLARMPSIHVESTGPGALGHYTSPGLGDLLVGDPHGEKHGRITIDPATTPSEMGHTLIHELGHHLDYHADPVKFNQRGWDRKTVPGTIDGGVASPALEGYAEGYAQRHVRNRGGETPPLSYRGFVTEPEFAERYTEASGGMKAHEHTTAQPKGYSPIHNPNQFQAHLFVRRAEIAESRTNKDYGQWSLESHSDEPLGTIKVGRGVPSDTSAEGFEPGDADVVRSMQWSGSKQETDPKTKRRVASAWNERYPNEPLDPKR